MGLASSGEADWMIRIQIRVFRPLPLEPPMPSRRNGALCGLTLVLLLLAACAPKPPSIDLIHQDPGERVVSVQELAASSQVSPMVLRANEEAKGTLGPADPKVSLKGSNSFCKVYSLATSPGASHQFTLNSYCACFGFDKRVMVPIVKVYDENAQEIPLENVKYQPHKAAGITPFHLSLEASFTSRTSSSLRLMVIADNSTLDRNIANVAIADQNGSRVMELNILSYPLGDFTLNVRGK